MRNIRRILVAVKDPKSKSLSAMVKAAQLARAWGAELELFHGVGTTRPNFLSPPRPGAWCKIGSSRTLKSYARLRPLLRACASMASK
jgi:hypothetical protein